MNTSRVSQDIANVFKEEILHHRAEALGIIGMLSLSENRLENVHGGVLQAKNLLLAQNYIYFDIDKHTYILDDKGEELCAYLQRNPERKTYILV